MIRLPPSVAQWVTAASTGLLFSTALRIAVREGGAAPAAIALTAGASMLLLAAASRLGPPHPVHRILLAIPTLLALLAEPVRGAIVETGASLQLHSHWTAIVWGLICATAVWPSARIAATGLRGHSGRMSGIAWALGLLVPTNSILIPLLLAAFGLCVADSVHPYERGKRPNKHQFAVTWAHFACGALLAGGWVQIRTVFDPSVSGALVVAAGCALGATWLPRSLSRNMPWTGSVLGMLIIFHHSASDFVPRLASLGFNHLANVPGLLWLALPLAAWGGLCGSILPRRDALQWHSTLLFAVGIWLGPSLLTYSATFTIAVTLLGLAALMSASTWRRATAIGALAFLVTLNGWLPAPDSALTRKGVWSHAHSARALATWGTGDSKLPRLQHGSTPDGTFITWGRTDEPKEAAVAVDGLMAHTRGKHADAEEFTAHLAALLSPRKEPTLLLNDVAGNALRGLAAHPDRITHIAASAPAAIRSLAAIDPVRERLWLRTNHILHPAHGSRLLAMSAKASTIIEISRAPWADGSNAELNAQHIESVKARLASDGMYALCMHTRWWPDGGVHYVAEALVAHFEHVQLWVPPEGVESVIFVASDLPPEMDQLRARFSSATTALEGLGFRSADAIIGSALLGTAGVSQWAAQSTSPPPTDALNGSIFDKPVLHLGTVPDWMEQDPEPWTTPSSPAAQQVRQARRALLTMIQSAASGAIEGTFEAAAQLSTELGQAGQQSLEELIAPYLRDSRSALELALLDGPDSERWTDAIRFVTTARMLAPRSALPLTVEGDIALAKGDVAKANEKFEAALAIDPKHVPALEGLARCARLTNNLPRAEQALRDATRHSPRDWRTWHNLGVFFLETGSPQKARDAIEVAVPLAGPDQTPPLLALTTILLDMEEPGAALLRAEQLVNLAPKNGLAWFLRGRAHYELNRWAEAESDFREAVLLDSTLVEARSGIGLVRAVLGDNESAANVFRDVLKRDPDNSAARENLRRLSAVQDSP